MHNGDHIRYCQRRDIDPVKWDACIDKAPNGLIYARTFYLDSMAESWDGVILNDYEAVMPLSFNKKYGFYYIYQPYFATGLGIFGEAPESLPVALFLEAIPFKFRYWDFALNEFNFPTDDDLPADLDYAKRINHFLYLGKPYEEIADNYKRLAARALRKVRAQNLIITQSTDTKAAIDLYRSTYPDLGVPAQVYDRLYKCMDAATERGSTVVYTASTRKGEIVAFYLLLVDDKFVYSLLGGSTEQGKELGAFYLLTDEAIKLHAGTKRIFRFEGSDIPGIAFFDAQFGADLIKYPYFVANKLPWPIRWLKPSHHQPLTR